jgi:hypothetical protein
MNAVEKMRQKQQAQGHDTKPTASMAAEAPAVKPAQPKPAATMLRFSCGHERPLSDFTGRKCSACRQEAAKRRRAQKEAKPARLDAQHGRLPDGAVYEKTYSAATETWTATLAIPGLPVLEATASGSFTVERALDRMYRERLQATAAAASTDDESA